ncbi:MAG: peptide-N(4)-(N-acetyl-beta-glucosaminyl)asparagine amidase [Acidobacteriaceae bacterium]|nr:peptide-N(4)-(N-acetyl-beta-glucosaminyl)asparagine amidase [Acidobacteriaceae bacterium]MBV9778754.1 peptide-N(4)-(N-acetyl-beta-glucosaminyl)asparagine amidase [Acidobacteriaceae bacterium]
MRRPQILDCNLILTLIGSLILIPACATAQSNSGGSPNIGSPDTVTADPPIQHPNVTPCDVKLFSNYLFENFNTQTFTYNPPAACPGPWAKIVFTADFSVTAGRQYDRTGEIQIGNVTVYFGTTAEPSKHLSPSWHVERDLTDYTALLEQPQAGEVELGNLVNSTYTGIIHGSAGLRFYPLCQGEHAPLTPDVVLAFPNVAGAQILATPASQLTQTYSLPTNIERAYFDVFAQSQSNDEFWYTCVPNDVATELQSCGNTAFRETEISIDGKPAGVAPVYPWIFTGGIDPYLWRPIPGVQTLNFAPYRVDLTPFAGLLSDGHTHEIGMSVYNVNNYFNATATLFLYLDHGSKQVTGELTENTLSAEPSPNVKENLKTSGSNISGTVTVSSSRDFTIAGYVNTSHGKVQTRLNQTMDFSNAQDFTINATRYVQDIAQSTKLTLKTWVTNGGVVTESEKKLSFPLTVDIALTPNSDGSLAQATKINQRYLENNADKWNGSLVYSSNLSNTVSARDILDINSSFQITGHQDQSSAQHYFFSDSKGECYSRDLTAANDVLTSVTDGKGCPGGRNHYWA